MSTPYMKMRCVLDARSGAVSGPVRVSYFDPRTGEPSPTKCEPLGNRDQEDAARAKQGCRASMERGQKKRPVVVDGRVFESINAAARSIGTSHSHLGNILRAGGTEHRGHSVRFARDAAPAAKANAAPHRARAVTVDGARYATVKQAAEAIGCAPGTIHNALKAGRERVKGHAVAYA
ncbi:NUMOD1 domain-containing DNA-binding protein [Gordonibacter pamelaeae]|uniref:NUMOD1 domain-containing DNA-binding protein n=1 Tax=Gordonibacter pamelaeae TaxID=471189 RepID=UPI003A9221B2